MTLTQFLLSPGFGGLAAVVAAVIAYAAAVRTARVAHRNAVENLRQRAVAERKAQWWERARWALDAINSPDATTRATGYNVLAALANSAEWAGTHEGDLIVAATRDIDERFSVAHTEDQDNTDEQAAGEQQ